MADGARKIEIRIQSTIHNILRTISDIVFVIDNNSHIVTATESFCELFELDCADVVGKHLFEICSGYWNQPAFTKNIEKIKSGNIMSIDMELETDLDKNYRRIFSLSLFKFPQIKELNQIIIISIKKLIPPNYLSNLGEGDDIQAMKLAQFSLEQAPDAVFWLNREGEFTYVNHQACRSLGYTRDELIKLNLWDIDPIYPKENWNRTWKNAKIRGYINTEHILTRHKRKNGEEFPVEIANRHISFGEYEFHVSFARDITERKMNETTLKITQSAIDNASIACFWVNKDNTISYVNEQACKSLGYSEGELLGKSIMKIDPEFSEERFREYWEEIVKVKAKIFETTHKRKDGTTFPVELTANYIEYDGEFFNCVYARDISENRRAEEEKAELEMQLYQAQKMETVGRLAGGIAHDFNNMLSVILGYTEMLKERLVHDPVVYEDLLQVEKAANHSKDITRQLLAFSRKQIIAPKSLDINELIESTRKTLIRLIGENIKLEFNPNPAVWLINFDPSQLDQIFVNLAVNARDAMPNGGKLTISTDNVHADEDYCREHLEVEPGDYVLLTIRDNGVGMDRDTLSYIFEPFFTTKSVDQGTGLGLATVYGIVMQNQGFISVQSKVSVGTTFNIYIPKLDRTTEEDDRNSQQNLSSQPVTGTILLVEDDDMLRRMTTLMLEDIGYTVLSAEGPGSALKMYKEQNDNIDLLMTDVVMPEMSGIELKQEISKLNPKICTLFMSGYTSNVIVDHGVLEEGVHFIQKPFSMNELDKRVRDALAGVSA